MALDLARQAVLIDMAYEIGGKGLAGFVNLLTGLRAGLWGVAASELRKSKLYSQVPKREDENIEVLRFGQLPFGVESAEGLVKRHEGCIFAAKPDAKGMWAIGWGHDVPPPPGGYLVCSQQEANAWFETDFALAQQRAQTALGLEYW